MDKKVEKVFQISDGLASLVHKKVVGLVKDLQGEKVLTSAESQKVMNGLAKVKKSLYDNVSGELKKILDKKARTEKSANKKKRV